MTIKHMQELRKQHAQRSKSDEKVRFKDMLSSAGASIDTSGKRGQIDNLDIQQLRYARSLYESVLVGVHIMMVVLTVFPSRAKEMWEEWCNEVPHTLRKGNKIKSPFPKKIFLISRSVMWPTNVAVSSPQIKYENTERDLGRVVMVN